MDYCSDRPITNIDEDLLGRASFSKQLGNAIYKYNFKDSLVIGLFGKWGTGKTSVINMAFQEIEKLSENDENKPIIVRFAPWNYSNKDNLIAQFFSCLKESVEIDDNSELKRKVGKALEDYAALFDVVSLVPVVGTMLASMLKDIAKEKGEALSKTPDLNESKKNLEDALIESNLKIIVLIDDIDRLTNSQIRDVFQLVKQVGDLSKIVYILSMDRNVVERALSEVHQIDGAEYLEKIVQVPFEIPELSQQNVRKVFLEKLDSIIKSSETRIVLDQKYWGQIFQYCVVPYLNTLRDVNRVVNTLLLKFSMLVEETSFEDLVGLATLEVLEPKLYKWISLNKTRVCGGFLHGILANNKHPNELRQEYLNEFVSLGIDGERAVKSVAAMFPIFANDVNEHFNGLEQAANLKSHMRVAEESRFDLYFVLDMEHVKVSRELINKCIYELTSTDLIKTINEVNASGDGIYFLEEFRALIERIPYDRLQIIAESLLRVQGNIKGEYKKAMFVVSAGELTRFVVEDVFDRLETQNERYEVLSNELQQADLFEIGAIAEEINRIELAYGRLQGNQENKEKQIISVEQLEKLEEQFIERLKNAEIRQGLIEATNFYMVFYLWECFDRQAAQDYMSELLKDEILTLKYVCRMAGKWHGTDGEGWSFYPDQYSDYISSEAIYGVITSFDKKEMEKHFDEEEMKKLASFVLNYNREDEMDHVNMKSAEKLVKEWKNEIK